MLRTVSRAFGYVRVSGRSQLKGDGFRRQSAAIRQYAEQNGIRVVRIFREEGVSGAAESTTRPAFTELLEALHGNGVNAIIVERLDRLARDLLIQETILADLAKHGFTLVSVAEPDLMANDPTRVLLRQMMGAVAQYDKAMIVTKLRAARLRKKARTGRCEGAKPYGYYTGEKAVIERMKALRAQGMGFDRIARQLNEDGIKPRRGKQWWGLTVNKILTGKGRGQVADGLR